MTPRMRQVITGAVIIVLLIVMALSTRVVSTVSAAGQQTGAFSADSYGKTEFPKVQAAIEKKATDARTLAAAIAADRTAAAKKYGVPAGTGPEFSVKFTGVVGAGSLGVYPVTVAGMPASVLIRIQTGPAINGTDLRDAPGTIQYGQFVNQIDYQNAASALNKQMKASVLASVDTANLVGKTVTVIGAFQLINPNGWLVTPAKLSVQ
ncbi:DUF2291 family protein [Lysinimonas soli]|uniref:DUF2291 family protein n=1 Tax=Lysinimonas soli TaxID=1074233 RepID=A0ABW0NL49_9MICO